MVARMAWLIGLVLAVQLIGGVAAEQDMETRLEQLTQQMEANQRKTAAVIEQLSRQVMLQQLFMEERIRSDGGSGLKQSRQYTQGTLPYHADTANGGEIAAIHEHPSVIGTVGSGEFVVVLNGVEFRTRHNDYRIVQSQTISTGDKIKYDSIENIQNPDVPPEVTSKGTVQEQIQEMREWFKAWRDQDHSIRDYRKYFKAVLCILEGGWTVPYGSKMEEPFDSLRHHINAKTWEDLQDKIRFTSSSGHKEWRENFAYLPTTIISTNNGTLNIAQWNYRIVCHPVTKDLSTKRLTLIDDITSRIAFGRSMESHDKSRAARYRFAPKDEDDWNEQIIKGDLLDELMAEIPGKDGYGNELLDDGIDERPAMDFKAPRNLSAGYYHRWFKAQRGEKASQVQHRAYSDENLFMAMTSQEKIPPVSMEKCTGKGANKKCSRFSQRWTYAIPLDLMYLTPLHRWNPYNFDFKESLKEVKGDGLLTGQSEELAFNGTHQDKHYLTPLEFYVTLSKQRFRGDSGTSAVWVRDSDGVARQVVASGSWIRLPEIDGIGRLRLRYPVMPLHYEGGAAWKELTALKDIILKPKQHNHMFYSNDLNDLDIKEPVTATLKMKMSRSKNSDPHIHLVYVNKNDLQDLTEKRVTAIKVISEEGDGHTHSVTLRVIGGKFVYTECDDAKECWDKHSRILEIVDA